MRGFFLGDSNGETMPATEDAWVRGFLVGVGPNGSELAREEGGGGVRFAARWAEIRADFRGE